MGDRLGSIKYVTIFSCKNFEKYVNSPIPAIQYIVSKTVQPYLWHLKHKYDLQQLSSLEDKKSSFNIPKSLYENLKHYAVEYDLAFKCCILSLTEGRIDR